MATDTPTAAPTDSEETPTLSVVLPTMNEEAGIEECLDAIEDAVAELGVTAEVIVSDSSTDGTPEIARDHGAIVVEPDRQGYGYAYRYAFERARGEYVVMGDADTTYDFRELPKLFERASEGADLVLGSRFAGDIKTGSMPRLHQYVGNPALTAFLNRFYGAGVTDAHSGFRVIRRDVLEELALETDGMEFASEMIMAASAQGYDIAEVPITYHERVGEATLDSFRDGWEHLRFMLVNAPGYLFSVPGAVLAAVGIAVMLLAFGNATFIGIAAGPIIFGTRSMVAGSLLTIAGYQVASLGVFATMTTDPIRRPADPPTEWVLKHLRLERGLAAGLALVGTGTAYAGAIVLQWLTDGYGALPALTHDILAFTIIVLGIQTVFGSFFLGSVRDEQ
ncbi:glycosyltransferase family 2 protein [Haloarcula halophila]|uniref:glycosyltransferase family 2 protein n=1 Tax=Haloarcula TaxID=2237 RepID=UPI0023E47441|nr:glycosyltransferase family 2 protein [Halomicroarcula sp. DFY41]